MTKQQDHESPERAEAFERYARMRHRSLRDLAAELGRARSTLEKWSKDGEWAERVRARDAAAARVAEDRWIEEVKKRRRQKRVTGEQLLARALRALAEDETRDMEPADIVRYIRVGDTLLDQVVSETEPADGREIEALVEEFAEDEGLDVEQALADSAALEQREGAR